MRVGIEVGREELDLGPGRVLGRAASGAVQEDGHAPVGVAGVFAHGAILNHGQAADKASRGAAIR